MMEATEIVLFIICGIGLWVVFNLNKPYECPICHVKIDPSMIGIQRCHCDEEFDNIRKRMERHNGR